MAVVKLKPLPVDPERVPGWVEPLDGDPEVSETLHVAVSCPGCGAVTDALLPLPNLALCAFCDRTWREWDWVMPEPYPSLRQRLRMAWAILRRR